MSDSLYGQSCQKPGPIVYIFLYETQSLRFLGFLKAHFPFLVHSLWEVAQCCSFPNWSQGFIFPFIQALSHVTLAPPIKQQSISPSLELGWHCHVLCVTECNGSDSKLVENLGLRDLLHFHRNPASYPANEPHQAC